jgi:hypothetical protein
MKRRKGPRCRSPDRLRKLIRQSETTLETGKPCKSWRGIPLGTHARESKPFLKLVKDVFQSSCSSLSVLDGGDRLTYGMRTLT